MYKHEAVAVAVAPAAGIRLHVAPPSSGAVCIPNAAGAPEAPVLRPSHTHAALDVRPDLRDFAMGAPAMQRSSRFFLK